MKKIILLSMLFNAGASFALTKEWVVTKIVFDDAKKNYQVDFKNQAGVYRADEKFISCLRESLKDQKAVQIEFNPMGLAIKSCEKVASR